MLAADDPKTGKPMVDIILDRAGQKGTGRWSAIEAQTLGVPATAIEAAVAARVLSAMKDERVAAEKVYGGTGRVTVDGDLDGLRADLELALLAGKIAAYAQGFAVMDRRVEGIRLEPAARRPSPRSGAPAASSARSSSARIAAAFGESATRAQPADGARLHRHDEGGASGAAPRRRRAPPEAGLPMPALSSALAYFDSYRQGRGTSNLIQAQRDFFGAHGFERIDAEGAFHGPWGSGHG